MPIEEHSQKNGHNIFLFLKLGYDCFSIVYFKNLFLNKSFFHLKLDSKQTLFDNQLGRVYS